MSPSSGGRFSLENITCGKVNENPLISPLEHVVSANVPRDRWDRKSLDEGAHYLGKRWQGVRVAEYLPSSSGIGRFCF